MLEYFEVRLLMKQVIICKYLHFLQLIFGT